MSFKVKFHAQFVPEWRQLDMALKERVGDILDHLEDDGPFLGRPEVDTLSGSKHTNMKEIRAKHGREIWRFAFAFDPIQRAVILCGSDKQGLNQQLFYKQLIAKADTRFDEWLERMKNGR
jgi:hypothetical protein